MFKYMELTFRHSEGVLWNVLYNKSSAFCNDLKVFQNNYIVFNYI